MFELEFNSVIELLDTFNTEQVCIDHLEWLLWDNDMPLSPFNESSKVYKCANNRYKCKITGKYFNVKTDTIFEDSKIPLRKWFVAIYLLTAHKKGVASVQLSKDISVTQKTAWYMLQRIRKALGYNDNDEDKLSGFVEIDEAYMGGDINKEASKEHLTKLGNKSKYQRSRVIGMIQREGEVRTDVMPEKFTSENVLNRVKDKVNEGAVIFTDAASQYKTLHGKGYLHYSVTHGKKEYVRGQVHTNSIEGYWSLFKRGVFGIYHFTSKKHLNKYLDEFSYRFNTRDYTDSARFDLALCKVHCGRLPYKVLIEKV